MAFVSASFLANCRTHNHTDTASYTISFTSSFNVANREPFSTAHTCTKTGSLGDALGFPVVHSIENTDTPPFTFAHF